MIVTLSYFGDNTIGVAYSTMTFAILPFDNVPLNTPGTTLACNMIGFLDEPLTIPFASTPDFNRFRSPFGTMIESRGQSMRDLVKDRVLYLGLRDILDIQFRNRNGLGIVSTLPGPGLCPIDRYFPITQAVVLQQSLRHLYEVFDGVGSIGFTNTLFERIHREIKHYVEMRVRRKVLYFNREPTRNCLFGGKFSFLHANYTSLEKRPRYTR